MDLISKVPPLATGGSLVESPPPGDGQMSLEKILEEWNGLNNDKIELDKRCGEIVSFFISISLMYLEMIGVGLIVFFIESNIVLWLSFGVFVSVVVAVGVGSGALLSLSKLNRMQWKFNRIDRRREELEINIHDFKKYANTSELERVNQILCLVDHDGHFRKDHMIFLGLTYFCSLLFLVSLAGWVYVMHTGYNSFHLLWKKLHSYQISTI